jgi:glycerate 2-kinase
MSISPPELLQKMFEAAISVALPEKCIADYLPARPKGRTLVIGAGKAAGAMAHALEKYWDGPVEGLVVTRYDHSVPTKYIEVVEARHPVPDEAGLIASKRIMQMVDNLSSDDLVICLISGGGSALLSLPADGISLEDKQSLTNDLLHCGATITEINCVRKHLSGIKGGRLAVACYPAQVVSLIISDVPGDDLSSIASGVTAPDPSTYAQARAILEKYGITPMPSISKLLNDEPDETPKPGSHHFVNIENILIATPLKSLVAEDAGYKAMILSDRIEGEARYVAEVHGAIARQVIAHNQPLKRPAVLLSGGETTVTLREKGGRGGRNAEFMLALAISLAGCEGVYAIACDSDGIDGSEDNAGAMIMPNTLSRAQEIGLNAQVYLKNHDAYSFFEKTGDLVMTGPTLTNVNDFRAIIIE